MAIDHESYAPDSTPIPSPEPPTGERVAPPIEGRFLFVDVAAQRAKQLRRGALPRLPELRMDTGTSPEAEKFHKLERVAMEEVTRGLIAYSLPYDPRRPGGTA